MNVVTMPLEFTLFGQIKRVIYPVVLKDENGLILVDCGYPDTDFLPKIESAMEQKGLKFNDITKIIITHHDYDHIGALKEIVDQYPAIKVFCSNEQSVYITGKEKPLRLLPAEAIHESLSALEKEENQMLIDLITSAKTIDEVEILNYDEIIPICDGVKVIDTSGHMPGHISLYAQKEKTLIAGDALLVVDGELCFANPEFVLNMNDAINSVANLLHYDIEKVICYHGGEYVGDIKAILKRILEENQYNFN